MHCKTQRLLGILHISSPECHLIDSADCYTSKMCVLMEDTSQVCTLERIAELEQP
jgi:hypothetical protein